MMDEIVRVLMRVAILGPPILLALTVHEVSHGVVALWRGDPTAKLARRLTLNPVRHLDPMGTLVFFITAWVGAGIGWAKPVPVNPANLKDPRRDMIWVSAAGPVANLLFAWILALVLGLIIDLGFFRAPSQAKYFLAEMFMVGVQINVVLAFFNLIPLPPLDGSGILGGLLPPRAAYKYQSLGRYGFLILLALIFLPGHVPGFPDFIEILVLWPAQYVVSWLLPYLS